MAQPEEKGAATAAALAAMEFEPWKMNHPPGKPGPSGKVMNNLGVAARFAAAFRCTIPVKIPNCRRSAQPNQTYLNLAVKYRLYLFGKNTERGAGANACRIFLSKPTDFLVKTKAR
jgi:hypothetical protein